MLFSNKEMGVTSVCLCDNVVFMFRLQIVLFLKDAYFGEQTQLVVRALEGDVGGVVLVRYFVTSVVLSAKGRCFRILPFRDNRPGLCSYYKNN